MEIPNTNVLQSLACYGHQVFQAAVTQQESTWMVLVTLVTFLLFDLNEGLKCYEALVTKLHI